MTPAMLLNCSGRFGWWRHTEHSVADAPQLCAIFLEGKATPHEVRGWVRVRWDWYWEEQAGKL